MFKLSVPISTKTLNKSNREKYLKQLREAGVQRIFLCGVGAIADEVPERVVENVRFFKSEGFEVGVWIGALGHGFVLVGASGEEEKYEQIVSITGERMHHANCPLDAGFRKDFAEFVGKIARTGADIIMLDDDFRMSQREEDISCACPMHLKRIGEILGKEITRDELCPYVLSGKANKYRDAFLQAQEEGLQSKCEAKSIRYLKALFCAPLCPYRAGMWAALTLSA